SGAVRGPYEAVSGWSGLIKELRSFGQHEERLSFFDNIGRELGPVAAADILCCVNCSRRDEQDIARLDGRRLVVDLILQRPFQDVDDLFARMCVPGSNVSGVEID